MNTNIEITQKETKKSFASKLLNKKINKNTLSLEKYKNKSVPYIFVLPNLIIFTLFFVIPVIIGFGYAFTDYDGLLTMNYVGLKNFKRIFSDPVFWTVIKNTLIYVGLMVPMLFFSSLFAAVVLTKKYVRFKGIFRSIYYWPVLISGIIVGLIWKWILGNNFGIMNYALESMNLQTIGWLTESIPSKFAIVLATLWTRIGFFMVIFMGGLENIPDSYYEAAAIDGATPRQTFWRITFPLLKPTSFLVLILTMMESFKAYPLILALTGGGPGSSTTLIIQYIYEEGFQRMNVGYASAVSMVMVLILGIMTTVQFKINKGGKI